MFGAAPGFENVAEYSDPAREEGGMIDAASGDEA